MYKDNVKILIDENDGDHTVARLLREMGYDVLPINKLERRRSIEDPEVLKIAIKENRFIITKDTGFFKDKSGKPVPVHHAGAILLKGQFPIKQQEAERLAWTIHHIIQNPEILNNFAELERPSPYGVWKLRPQGENTVFVEWLAYFVEHTPITSYGEMISVPGESQQEKD